MTLAGLAFLCFDLVFLPPYGTLVVERPLDWVVLGAFLVTSVVAAQLFDRARAEADAARRRAEEVDRLSALGAETLDVGRAEDAVGAVADVVRSALALDSGAVYLRDEAHDAVLLVRWTGEDAPARARGGFADLVGRVARTGAPLAVRSTGVVDILPPTPEPTQVLDGLAGDVREVVLPLRVRDRTVGVLSLGRPAAFALEPSQRRFLNALAYYAALGVDRVRLVAEAEHADALRTAARLEDAVVASVSHDLRTPLTTIKALAHDLAASGDERAMTIEEEANRLNPFVADLLDLSRLNSGTASLAPEPNEAEDLLGAALQRVDGPARGREIRVSLEEGEPLRFGRFDFAQTLRALVNLIENAVKHSPPGQAVDVAVRREGAWLAFSVADRGPGVPSEARERIFEPFYRPPDTAPDVGGAGLGLSIARVRSASAAARIFTGSLCRPPPSLRGFHA
jgi:two-component system sensor histidine kinase KdpD